MKNLKLLVVAFVAMLGFTACNKDCGHEFIEYDYSEALVGTWTYLEGEQAEAMVINPDGSFNVTGIMKGGSMYEEKGTIKVVNNKVSLVFDGDTDVVEGRLELVSGKSLSIVINEEYDIRLTYDYCENDLADEIVGMWVVANGTPDMTIETYYEDGRSTFTGIVNGKATLKHERNYKVVGDLSFHTAIEDPSTYVAQRLIYSPNATSYGDLMTWQLNNDFSFTRLRIKQSLDLKSNNKYDFIQAYVSNAKGKDEDFNITDCTFNMSNIASGNFDVMFRSVLYCVELNANSIKQNFMDGEFETPITVDGNKVTLNMNAANPAFRDVDMYMFQDDDNTQLHIYMPTSSFINYMANLEIVTKLQGGTLDPTDTTVVAKVFADMEARVESINLALVLRARK